MGNDAINNITRYELGLLRETITHNPQFLLATPSRMPTAFLDAEMWLDLIGFDGELVATRKVSSFTGVYRTPRRRVSAWVQDSEPLAVDMEVMVDEWWPTAYAVESVWPMSRELWGALSGPIAADGSKSICLVRCERQRRRD